MRYIDIIPPPSAIDLGILRWLHSLPTFGWSDESHAYLIVPGWDYPSRTVILKEPLNA